MSLKGRLKEFDGSRKRPPEIVAIIRRGIDYVRESEPPVCGSGSAHRTSPFRSDATSEVLKKYRLWFAVPGEVKTLYLEKFGRKGQTTVRK